MNIDAFIEKNDEIKKYDCRCTKLEKQTKKFFLVKQFLKVDNYDIFVLFSFTKVDTIV